MGKNWGAQDVGTRKKNNHQGKGHFECENPNLLNGARGEKKAPLAPKAGGPGALPDRRGCEKVVLGERQEKKHHKMDCPTRVHPAKKKKTKKNTDEKSPRGGGGLSLR